jgi:hypothetical protein
MIWTCNEHKTDNEILNLRETDNSETKKESKENTKLDDQ